MGTNATARKTPRLRSLPKTTGSVALPTAAVRSNVKPGARRSPMTRADAVNVAM